VSERVASEQGNAVTVPDEPAIDLGWNSHVPVADRLWTWMRIPTSVLTRLHLRGPAVPHHFFFFFFFFFFFECRAQVRVLSGAPTTTETPLTSGYLLVEARSRLPGPTRRRPDRH
jgi:hypothetical protein